MGTKYQLAFVISLFITNFNFRRGKSPSKHSRTVKSSWAALKKTFTYIIRKPSKWEQSQASFVTGFYGAIFVVFAMASGEPSKSPDLRDSPGVLIGSVCCCDRRLSVTGLLSLPCILPVEALYLTSSRNQEDFEVYQIRWFFQDYLHSTFQLIYIDVCWTCLLVLRGWSLSFTR